MNRVLSIAALVAASTLALSACASSGTSDEAENNETVDSVTIGMMLSETGPSAFSGIDARQGIELAVKHLEEGILQGVSINLVSLDDATDPNQAVTAMQRLVGENVPVVIGGSQSNTATAATPIAQRAGVPFVVVNAYAPTVTETGDMIFQISSPTARFNTELAEAAGEILGAETAAIIYGQDVPTTVAFRDDYLAGFENAGIEVVADIAARSTDADFTTAVRTAMADNPDALTILFPGAVDGLVVKQTRALGYSPIFLGHVGDVGEAFITAAGEDGIGTLANTGFLPTANSPEVQDFVAAFMEEYDGEVPAAIEGQGYQGMMMVGQVIANLIDAGEEITPESIQAGLNGLGTQSSVLGSSGAAEFKERILTYDGFFVILDEDLQWVEWKP